MISVFLQALERYFLETFEACGLSAENAGTAADTFLRATLRGVGHHDVYDFPQRIRLLREGAVNANPEYRKIAAFGGIESWDGGNGLGEVVCAYAMDRAIELAASHGIGLCAMRNTNHFLAAAPYVERAAERGYIAVILCKGGVSMGAPDKAGNCMSALPMGFSYGTSDEYPVLFDACLAYASFGKLRAMDKNGEKTPLWWGLDQDGQPTDDPMKLAKGTRFPIGGHKGFGLAMLGEVLTSVLSMGCILDEKETADGLTNDASHTAIAIKADALMDMETFKERAGALSSRSGALSPGLHIPGMGSYRSKRKCLETGEIALDEELLDKLEQIGRELGVEPIGR